MICRCGHEEAKHHRAKSCTAIVDEAKLKYCKCEEFRVVKSEGENMPKKEKKAKVETVPKLAAFVDSPVTIYLTHEKKERQATILSSGLIRFEGKDYKSPCAAATAMAKDMGFEWGQNAWSALKFNKNGERVSLDTIRGAKSPLAKAPAKPKKVAKPKAARKPRATKKPVAKPEVADSDIPKNEAA